MTREGATPERDLGHPKRHFTDEDLTDKEMDILEHLDAISEKLKRLENNAPTNEFTALKSPFDEEENVSCKFIDTCYTAKNTMGNCPCELRVEDH